MLTNKIIKIANFLRIAEKINDIKDNVKADLISLTYGKNISRNKIQQFEQLLKQKKPHEYSKYNQNVVKTLGNISIVVNKYLQKGSPQLLWFYHRYIKQNKHIEDIINLDGSENDNGSLVAILKKLSVYQKYDKSTKRQLRDGVKNDQGRFIIRPQFDVDMKSDSAFQTLINLMQKKQNKNKKEQKKEQKKVFEAPKTLQKITIPGVSKYKVYKAYGNKKSDFEQLHNINGLGQKNPSANTVYQQYENYYASWCVVTGSVDWERYLQSPWDYYYYITLVDNTPYILMNFGTSSDAQIKDTHDMAFNNYDEEIITMLDYLSKKDNFNPTTNSDFSSYKEIKKLSTGKTKKENLSAISLHHNDKYNNVYMNNNGDFIFYEQDEPKFLLNNNGNIIKIDNKQKLNNYDLINALVELKQTQCLTNLIYKGILNIQNQKTYNLAIETLCEYDSDQITYLINQEKLQLTDYIVDKLFQHFRFKTLVRLIAQDKITKKSIIDKTIKGTIDSQDIDALVAIVKRLLRRGKLPNKFYNNIMEWICSESNSIDLCRFVWDNHLLTDKWKNEVALHMYIIKNELPEINDDIANYIIEKIIKMKEPSTTVSKLFEQYNIDKENTLNYIELIENNPKELSKLIFSLAKEQKQIDFVKQYATQKHMDNLLCVLSMYYQDMFDEEEKNKHIENIINNGQSELICDMINQHIITDQNMFDKAVNIIILSKNSMLLESIARKDVMNQMSEKTTMELLQSLFQLKGDELSNSFIGQFYWQSLIPYSKGSAFLKFLNPNAGTWEFIRYQFPKKYFNQQFIHTLLNMDNFLYLTESIEYDLINVKYIDVILNKFWNNKEFRSVVAKKINSWSSTRWHKPYRIAIQNWIINNDLNFIKNHFQQFQDELKNKAFNTIINNGSDDSIMQFISQYGLLNSKNADQIYNKIKDKISLQIQINLIGQVSEDIQKDIIEKTIQTKDDKYIDLLLGALSDLNYSLWLFKQLVQTLPIDIFKKLSFKNVNFNNGVVCEIISYKIDTITNFNDLLKLFVNTNHFAIHSYLSSKIYKQLDTQNQIKQFLKLFSGRRNEQEIKNLMNYNTDKFIPMLLKIDAQKTIDVVFNSIYFLHDADKIFETIINSNQKNKQLLFDKAMKYAGFNKKVIFTYLKKYGLENNKQANIDNSIKLYKLSKIILSNDQNDKVNECNQIITRLNKSPFVKTYVKKIDKKIQENNIKIYLNLKKQLDFIKQIIVDIHFDNEYANLNIDVVCDNNLLDNQYYILVTHILSSANKTFKAKNYIIACTTFIKNIFYKFNTIYVKNLKQQVNNND